MHAYAYTEESGVIHHTCTKNNNINVLFNLVSRDPNVFLERDLARKYSLKQYINKHYKQLRTSMKEISVFK